jgi:aminopeptidase N
MPIPLRIALFGELGAHRIEERLVVLDEAKSEIVFDGVGERPILSINRGFSAPVTVAANRDTDDLAFLAANDDDPFARYEAAQQLMLSVLLARIDGREADADAVVDAVRSTLRDQQLDHAFVAEAVLLPSEAFIGDQMAEVDPDAIHGAREELRARLGVELEAQWRSLYGAASAWKFELTPTAKGARRLRNVALGYLAAADAADAAAIALDQYRGADNMTVRLGALGVLVNGSSAEREEALADFYRRYEGNSLVIDKWFSAQALSTRDDTVETVLELARHPDFRLTNPNRVRGLVGAFAANQRAFHRADGAGYRFVAEKILELDRLNPQVAANLVPPLGRWRRFGHGRAQIMQAELRRILETPDLSRQVYEQVSKSLEG